jgi:hypothetical protein
MGSTQRSCAVKEVVNPGEAGQRNNFRGDGFFDIDSD